MADAVVNGSAWLPHEPEVLTLTPATFNPSDAPRDFKSIVSGTKPLTVTEKFIIGFRGTQFELKNLYPLLI